MEYLIQKKKLHRPNIPNLKIRNRLTILMS